MLVLLLILMVVLLLMVLLLILMVLLFKLMVLLILMVVVLILMVLLLLLILMVLLMLMMFYFWPILDGVLRSQVVFLDPMPQNFTSHILPQTFDVRNRSELRRIGPRSFILIFTSYFLLLISLLLCPIKATPAAAPLCHATRHAPVTPANVKLFSVNC
jgi:hypothetical protein